MPAGAPRSTTGPARAAPVSSRELQLGLAKHDALGGVGGVLDQCARRRPPARGSGRARRRRRGRGRCCRAGRRRHGREGSPRSPSSRLSDFSPLWPASPPPRRVRMSPNGRSISSWITSTRSSGTFNAPRAGLDRAPRLVHVRLRQEHRDPRTARTRAPLGQQPRRTSSSPAADPSARQRLATSKPTLWRDPACSDPGFPSPTISQSTGAPLCPKRTTRRGGYSPPDSPSAEASASAPPSPTTSVSVSISSLGSTVRRGGVTVTMTVSSSSSSSTPSGTATASSATVSPISSVETSWTIVSGIDGGERLDVELARDLLEHAAGLDAGSVLDAGAARARRRRGSSA